MEWEIFTVIHKVLVENYPINSFQFQTSQHFFLVHTKAPVSKYSIHTYFHTLLAEGTICIQSATILFADLTI